MISVLLYLSMAWASPEPCEKYDGAKYDECVDNLMSDDAVEVKEEDTKNTGEELCGMNRTAEGVKKCLEGAKRQTTRNAKERIQRENQGAQARQVAEAQKRCEPSTVISQCNSAHSKAQSALAGGDNDPDSRDARNTAIKSCIALCTLVTPSVDRLVLGCQPEEKTRILAKISDKHRTCSVPGGNGRSGNADANTDSGGAGDCKTAACVDRESERLDSYATPEDAENRKMCRSGQSLMACNTISDAELKKVEDLKNNRAPVTDSNEFYTEYSTPLEDGIKARKIVAHDTGAGPAPDKVEYVDAQGKAHDDYAKARESNCASGIQSACEYVGVPVPSPSPYRQQPYTPPGPVVTNPTPTTPRVDPVSRDPVVTRDPVSRDPVTTTKTDPTTTASNPGDGSETKRDPAATNGGSGAGPEASSGSSSSSSSSSSSGSSSGMFSNPFDNSNFKPVSATGGGSANSSSTAFAGTGTKSNSDMDSDSIGGNGEGVSSAGSFRGTGASTFQSVSGSEGVHRGSGAAFGGGGGHAPSGGVSVASLDRERSRFPNNGDFNSPSFQAGYHKTPGKEPLAQRKLRLANMLKKFRLTAKQAGCKDTDYDCLDKFFARGGGLKIARGKKVKSQFNQRGIASVNSELPKGVWRGYVDILSHISKVHDRLPLNFEGDIEEN